MKSRNNLVSIIIPVFNGEKFIEQAIVSALSQTHSNTEVIVVDDGSTDGTAAICNIYTDRINYIYQKNKGVAAALNLGIKRAKGDYISWLSHDDFYAPEKIEKEVAALACNLYSTIVYSNFYQVDESSKIVGSWPIEKVHNPSKLSQPLYPVMKGLINGCTLLIPKAVFEKNGLFDESLRYSQDYDMWFRIFPTCQVIHLNDYLLYSRVHSGQGTHHPQALIESNKIWIKMISQIDEKDMAKISDSKVNFYLEMREQMRRAGFNEAVSYLDDKLNKITLPFSAKLRRILLQLR